MLVWGWVDRLGLGGEGVMLMGFGVCGVGPSGFFGVWALYINLKK